MKFVNLLLSIYIIALSCLPCSDAEGYLENKAALIITQEKPTSEHHNDSCSPFCICNCCRSIGFYKTTDYTTSTIIKTNCENTKIGYIPIFISTFYSSIWLPPKIC